MSELFVGVNLWQAMWWGAFDRPRLERELDHVARLGVSVVRVLAGSEGPDSAPHRVVPSLSPDLRTHRPELVEGLAAALDALRGRDMRAIVCLGNFWHWSGGIAQYRAFCDGTEIPYPVGDAPDWNGFARYATGFYDMPAAMALFDAHVAKIVEATRDHDAVFLYEILNEPRGMDAAPQMRAFLHRTASAVRALTTHPIALGSEGSTDEPEVVGLSFERDHDHPAITHTTIHVWPENWGRWDPQANDDEVFEDMLEWTRRYVRSHAERAAALGRPLVIEELGLSRDGGRYNPDASTERRDRFFATVRDEVESMREDGLEVVGIVFWAWAGEVLATRPGGPWRVGDPLSGDPPHEPQGWYGIGGSDTSTHQIIQSVGHLARRSSRAR